MPHAVAHVAQPRRGRAGQAVSAASPTSTAQRRVTGRFRGGAGRGVRRTALHAALLEAATAAGVRIEHGEIGPVSQDATSVHCSGFQARYLAAADGLHSPIRAALGLARPSGGAASVGNPPSPCDRRRGATASRCTGPTTRRPM